MRWFPAIVVALAWCAATDASCASNEDKVDCVGCDFDTQENVKRIAGDTCWANIGNEKVDPDTEPPTGWSWEGNNFKLIQQGCRAWGSLDSGDGEVYFGLQGSGQSIWRTWTGLDTKGMYVLKFLAAERPNGPNAHAEDAITVYVNSNPIANELSPFFTFTEHTYHFYADAKGNAEIKFKTTFPRGNDITILLDKIEVFKSVDCGEGASCHEPLLPRTGYTCRCDVPGFKGHDVAEKKASCATKSTGEALTEELAEVKETVATLETGAIELTSRASGVQASLAQNFEADGAVQTELDSLKEDVAAMKVQLETLTKANVNLKAILRNSFKVGEVPSDDGGAAGETYTYAPSVTTDGAGSIDLDVKEGTHAKVNGKALLTGEEVREMIRTSVAAVLTDMGDAL